MAFRLKCKKYVKDRREFLVSLALAKEGSAGMTVMLMSDELTDAVVLSVDEYNALPYHWFEDMGPAPKARAVKPTEI